MEFIRRPEGLISTHSMQLVAVHRSYGTIWHEAVNGHGINVGYEDEMKNKTYHSTGALLIGAAGMYVFFALIGAVSVLSTKQGLHQWVFRLPKPFQETAILAHHGVEAFIVSLIVFGTLGFTLGKLSKEKPVMLGFFEFIGAITFYFAYHYLVFHGNFLWIDDVPIWSQLLPFFIWLLICLSAPLVGNSKFRRHLTP